MRETCARRYSYGNNGYGWRGSSNRLVQYPRDAREMNGLDSESSECRHNVDGVCWATLSPLQLLMVDLKTEATLRVVEIDTRSQIEYIATRLDQWEAISNGRLGKGRV